MPAAITNTSGEILSRVSENSQQLSFQLTDLFRSQYLSNVYLFIGIVALVFYGFSLLFMKQPQMETHTNNRNGRNNTNATTTNATTTTNAPTTTNATTTTNAPTTTDAHPPTRQEAVR